MSVTVTKITAATAVVRGEPVEFLPCHAKEYNKAVDDLTSQDARITAIEGGSVTLTTVEAGDGTVSLPSFTFASDLDTGIYRIGANNAGFAAAGAKVLDISATGLGVTGTITSTAATNITSASATSLTVGPNGTTTPILSVDSATASAVAGLKITGAATGGTVALVTTDSGSATNLTISAKGTGTIAIGSVSTGEVTIRPATTITGTLTQTGAVTFGSINTVKATLSMTALAGGAQAGTALASEFNSFLTVTTTGDSAQLPVAILGKKVIVRNEAAKAMAVFGQTGDSINAGSANASFIVEPGQEITFEGTSGTTWVTNIGSSQATGNIVTQGTNITTGVTVNATRGIITTFSASTAALGACTFTVTNNKCTAASNVRVWIVDYAGTILTNGVPILMGTDNHTATGFDIIYVNTHATNALSGAIKIGFEVIN